MRWLMTPLLLCACTTGSTDKETRDEVNQSTETNSYSDDVETGLLSNTLEHDNETREYLLYVPDSYDPSTSHPVMLSFHGGTGTAEAQMYTSDMRSLADAEGFLLIYPQALDSEFGTIWNTLIDGAIDDNKIDFDDFGFVENLLDTAGETYNVDDQRVYATGYSNGAGLAYSLACHLNQRIAAIAPVSGLMWDAAADNCTLSHPTSVLILNGSNDNERPLDGYPGYMMSVDDTVSYWTDHNNINSAASTSSFQDSGDTIEHSVYSGGDNGSRVEYYKVIGGGHDWFGNDFNGQNLNELIWDFVSQHDLNGAR